MLQIEHSGHEFTTSRKLIWGDRQGWWNTPDLRCTTVHSLVLVSVFCFGVFSFIMAMCFDQVRGTMLQVSRYVGLEFSMCSKIRQTFQRVIKYRISRCGWIRIIYPTKTLSSFDTRDKTKWMRFENASRWQRAFTVVLWVYIQYDPCPAYNIVSWLIDWHREMQQWFWKCKIHIHFTDWYHEHFTNQSHHTTLVIWTHRSKLQWKLNQNALSKNGFESVKCGHVVQISMYQSCLLLPVALCGFQAMTTVSSALGGPYSALFFMGLFVPWVNWKVWSGILMGMGSANKRRCYIVTSPLIGCFHTQVAWGHHGAPLGPTGSRWAPCWPDEPCHLGFSSILWTTLSTL